MNRPRTTAHRGSLSILLVNWRSRDYLRRCLQTIAETCGELAPKVIVVDGASYDGCGEMLSQEFPSVQFIQCSENIGFGRCNNLGFEAVRTEFLLLLNPDTELRPGAVVELLRTLDEQPNAGIVAPKLLNSDHSLQTSCVQAFPTPLNQALDSEFLRHLFPRSSLWKTFDAFHSRTPIDVEVVSGACMLLRSSVFRELAGFRPEFFMYGEDVDLCFRTRESGRRVLFVPQAEVVHHGGGSSQQQVSGFSATMLRVATATFFHLNVGPVSTAMFRLLQGISAAFRLLLLALPFLIGSSARRLHTRASLDKWFTVLRWAFTGRSPLRKDSRYLAGPIAAPQTSMFVETSLPVK